MQTIISVIKLLFTLMEHSLVQSMLLNHPAMGIFLGPRTIFNSFYIAHTHHSPSLFYFVWKPYFCSFASSTSLESFIAA